jgi:putrescine transport system substrate-binding protein
MNAQITHRIGLAGLLALSMQSICAFAAENSEALLNVYNWADYIGEATLENFEREYGIKVNYDVYDTSEIVDTKLMAGHSDYDVVLHSAGFASRLIPIGIYKRLDKTKLTNWNNLDPVLLDRVAQYDPGHEFGVPYMWGTTGFSYNRDMIVERMPDAPLRSCQ